LLIEKQKKKAGEDADGRLKKRSILKNKVA
jgi:hypothetical protein